FNLYGEPGIASAVARWNEVGEGAFQKALAFINTSKYPPSLLFLCMTLGPALVLTPVLERWHGRLAGIVTVFGRVPFVFYILHIALIHAGSSVWTKLTLDRWQFHYLNNQPWPEGYDYALWRAYLVWIVAVVVLYWPCQWFMQYRRTHRQWWLSYL
ncbi:MAG: hypothetical protein HKN70_08530, partial [Gammaproteobacteria bacterium]|nr:hypothetical protein [Gammaproteobacteria bacterium]